MAEVLLRLCSQRDILHENFQGCTKENLLEGMSEVLAYGRKPRLTVDGIVMKGRDLLTIRRGNPPFMDRPALPGGFLDYGETLEEAVAREVLEETGLETRVEALIGVYSHPERDPRGHTVSAAYLLKITGGELKAGDDASDVFWTPFDELPQEMAFDHRKIIDDAIAYLKIS